VRRSRKGQMRIVRTFPEKGEEAVIIEVSGN